MHYFVMDRATAIVGEITAVAEFQDPLVMYTCGGVTRSQGSFRCFRRGFKGRTSAVRCSLLLDVATGVSRIYRSYHHGTVVVHR